MSHIHSEDCACVVKHPHHFTRPLMRYGQKVQIDIAIYELMKRLWAAGIETIESCEQDTDGRAYIDFPSYTDTRLFLETAAGKEIAQEMIATVRSEENEHTEAILSNGWVLHWTFLFWPIDGIVDDQGYTKVKVSRAAINYAWIHVEFPPEQIAELTAKFKE